MENTCCLLYMLILLLVVSTEETPLGPTEKATTDFTVKVTQEVEPFGEKGVLLETKNISALRGKEATLVINTIKESEIQDIQWVKNGINFATTKPKKDVTIRESSYNGKLRVSNDGSLIIQSVTIEDQGEYKADILLSDMKNYQIIYYLHVSEEKASQGSRVVVASVIAGLLLMVTGAGVVVMIRRKNRCCKSKKRVRGDPEGTSKENKLHLKVSSPSPQDPCDKTNDIKDNEDNDTFYDAPEHPEPYTTGGHTA